MKNYTSVYNIRPITRKFFIIKLYCVEYVEVNLFSINSKSEVPIVDIYKRSPDCQEWPSKDDEDLLVFLHVKNDKIHREYKLVNLHQHVFNNP